MGIYTKEEQFKLIREHPLNLEQIDNQFEDVCLEAVKEVGYALQFVKVQTEEICLEAVKQYGTLLEYVKEQTPEICLEAVKQDGYALQYVKEQTENICLEAVKYDGKLIKYVNNKTPKICLYAFLNDFKLLDNEYIQESIDKIIKNKNNLNKIIFKREIYDYEDEFGYDYYQDKVKDLFNKEKYDFINIDLNSLNYLKEYLLNKNSKNHFILEDNVDYVDINLLKDIALSNNELIIINTGKIKDFHKVLANKIIKGD